MNPHSSHRRSVVLGALGAAFSSRVLSQSAQAAHHEGQYESLRTPGRIGLLITPRHGLGAAVVGDAIHVAGGGPIMGGGVQSAVHEAFMLD